MSTIPPAQKPVTLIDDLAFAECLRWHAGRLYFSDMHRHRVMAVDAQGNAETICEVPGRPGGLGWLPDGRLLVVAMTERKLYRLDADGLRCVADLSERLPYFMNDMAVDARGYAYIGDIGFDYYAGDSFKPARLWLVKPDGSAGSVMSEMLSPNGPVIAPDGKTLIFAESSGARLTAFDIGTDGTLSGRRVWAELGDGVPDGIGMDTRGRIWAAMYGGKAVWCVEEGRGITRRIAFDRDTYACAVGGDDMRTLFVATATTHDPDECRARRDGRIEMVRID